MLPTHHGQKGIDVEFLKSDMWGNNYEELPAYSYNRRSLLRVRLDHGIRMRKGMVMVKRLMNPQ